MFETMIYTFIETDVTGTKYILFSSLDWFTFYWAIQQNTNIVFRISQVLSQKSDTADAKLVAFTVQCLMHVQLNQRWYLALSQLREGQTEKTLTNWSDLDQMEVIWFGSGSDGSVGIEARSDTPWRGIGGERDLWRRTYGRRFFHRQFDWTDEV